jgi:hypothetical protein
MVKKKFSLPLPLHGLNRKLFEKLRFQSMLLHIYDGGLLPAGKKESARMTTMRSRMVTYVIEQLAQNCIDAGGKNNLQLCLVSRAVPNWKIYIAVVKPDGLTPWQQLDQVARPIRNEEGYQAVLREIDTLMGVAPESIPVDSGTPEADRLEVLAILAEDYERKHPRGCNASD